MAEPDQADGPAELLRSGTERRVRGKSPSADSNHQLADAFAELIVEQLERA